MKNCHFGVASSNGTTYLFLKTTSLISKRERSKNFRCSILSSVLRLQCFCSMSYATCHACALSSVYLFFIFVQFVFASSFWTTCSQLKILSCLRGEACVTRVTCSIPARSSGINHDVPCCIEPELRSTCFCLMLIFVVLSCLRVVRRPQETSYPGWLIFEDNFVLLGQVLVGVHSWNRSWRIWKKEYSLQFTKVKIHTCILWLTTKLYHYVKYEVKTMFPSVSELLSRKDWRWSSA